MARQRLKLKQASAVLQVQPRELQNLVQFGVVKPQRSARTYFFDMKVLLAAKVAKLRRNLRANAETVCLPTPDTYISSVRELSL